MQQFGSTIVHDLNNAIFAISGRLELLKRRLDNPALQALAADLGKTIHFFESINASISAACARIYPHAEARDATDALENALTDAIAQSADLLQHVTIERESIPDAQRMLRAHPEALLVCVRQLLALHAIRIGARGTLRITSALHAQSITLIFEDDRVLEGDASLTALSTAPSFLHGGFEFEQLLLATAQRALRECGGNVVLARPEHEGMRSVVTFALLTQRRAIPQRVLIADDEMLIRALLVQMLETLGADVVPSDAPGSIDTHPDIRQQELIIVDAAVPTLCGLKALQRLRAQGVMTPAIVISGATIDVPLPVKTSALLKPFTMATFEAACYSALAL